MTSLQQKIVDHVRKTGRCPNWKSVGVNNENYDEGVAAFQELIETGVLVWVDTVTKTGRRSRNLTVGA